jgi:dTDP-4-amino-4,6-dideoxygalactose transaminase
MPIHFNDLDVVSAAAELQSALIVPCNMCPAATVAVREKKPFMQFFRSFLKSLPFEQYIGKLQSRLREQGVDTKVFRSNLYHQWFMCMWTSAQRKKLQEAVKKYEAVIVLGCDSATETSQINRLQSDRRHGSCRHYERHAQVSFTLQCLL